MMYIIAFEVTTLCRYTNMFIIIISVCLTLHCTNMIRIYNTNSALLSFSFPDIA